MKLYKLTTQDGYTRKGEENQTKWVEGNTYTKPKVKNPRLCSEDVYHAYSNLNLGLLLNSRHANIDNPRIWQVEGNIVCQESD